MVSVKVDVLPSQTMLKVQKQAKAIKKIQEVTLPNLRQQLAETTGIFKGKERGALEKQIQQTETELAEKLDKIRDILKDDGYHDVQVFMKTYRKAEYNQDLAGWDQAVKNGQKHAEKQRTDRPKDKVCVTGSDSFRKRVNRTLSRSRERNPKTGTYNSDKKILQEHNCTFAAYILY